MKKVLTAAMTAVFALGLPGCDALKEATSKDFTVNDVRFEFNTTVEKGGGTRAGTRAGEELNSFTVTRTVYLSEIGSEDVAEYAGMIFKAKATGAQLEVDFHAPGEYTVTGLKVEAAGVSGSPLVVPSLTVGGTFVPPSGIDAFTSAFVMKLITAGSVQVTVSGKTDAPPQSIVIGYGSDLVLTASLL